MKLIYIPYIIILLLFPRVMLSQGFTVSGTVSDEKTGSPLPGAHVILKEAADTLKQHASISDTRGRYRIDGVTSGAYLMHVSFVGYKSYDAPVEVKNRNFEMGMIRMNPSATMLNEVKIEEKAIPATQMGDTTQYKADAFKIQKDATAEELVQKMPGVEMEDGKVKAQGEEVKKVLVDGKPFFGNDPSAALRNLPAEVIDRIQLFDEQSEMSRFTGFDDGNTTKTMNIITRMGMRDGQFGKFTAGYGYDDKYLAGGSFNLFEGDRRITLLGMSNNTNQQNFAAEDLLGVMSSSGMGGGGGMGRFMGGGPPGGGGGGFGGGGIGGFMVPTQNGITTTHSAGVNYSDQWGKKIELSGSYFFNYNSNDVRKTLLRKFIPESDTGQVYLENSFSKSDNMNHRFDMRLDYDIDSSNSLLIRPRFTYQDNSSETGYLGETTLADWRLNQSDSRNTSDLNAFNLQTDVDYRHRFRKKGRTFSVELGGRLSNSAGDRFKKAEDIYFTGMASFDSLVDQYSDSNKDGVTLSSEVSYTEPLGQKGQLQLNYEVSRNTNESDKKTYDISLLTNEYVDLDTLLSSSFDSKYLSQQWGGGYRFNEEKYNFSVRLFYQEAVLTNEQLFPYVYDLEKTFTALLPDANFTWRPSRQKQLRISYNSRTNQPSVDQLQEVLDNSNTLQLSTGNAGLKQDYRHTVMARYSTTQAEKGNLFFAMLRGTVTQNYIGKSTYIAYSDVELPGGIKLNKGSQLTRPVNLDGYASIRGFVTYGLPVKAIKTNINLNCFMDYTKTPGEINEAINYAHTQNYGFGVTFASNISEKLDFTLSSNSRISFVENSIRDDQNSRYFSQNSRFRFHWTFFKTWLIQTDLSHYAYTGLSEDYNQNYLLWNASFGKKIFKNQRGEIKVSVIDLLNQNKSISRNVTETYIEDVEANSLQRYALLTFTYNLRNFGGKAPEMPRMPMGPPMF